MKSDVDIDLVRSVFAKTLIQLRKEAGLSQEKLSNKARLERAYISRLERSLVQPSLTTLIKISNGLEIEPDALFQTFLKDFKKL